MGVFSFRNNIAEMMGYLCTHVSLEGLAPAQRVPGVLVQWSKPTLFSARSAAAHIFLHRHELLRAEQGLGIRTSEWRSFAMASLFLFFRSCCSSGWALLTNAPR